MENGFDALLFKDENLHDEKIYLPFKSLPRLILLLCVDKAFPTRHADDAAIIKERMCVEDVDEEEGDEEELKLATSGFMKDWVWLEEDIRGFVLTFDWFHIGPRFMSL
jgi:hypothetical protein